MWMVIKSPHNGLEEIPPNQFGGELFHSDMSNGEKGTIEPL